MIGQEQPRPWDIAQRSTTQAQTGLLELADLKAKQQAEQEFLLAIKTNPALAQQLFGGSVLGSLQTAPGGPAPGPGPIMQSPLGGGPAQQIPASPDASRYANVPPTSGGPIPPNVMGQVMPTVTPPPGTPTLATIGPQGGMPGAPQGPMQGPQNPVLEMARRDPRAALLLQQQMQGQQDRQWKMQEQQLDMGVKVAEYVARELQGVTDQASTDAARERVRQVHPQAAAQIPQMYSKEAIETLQQKGIAVAKLAEWRKDMATAKRTELMTQRLPETMQRMSEFLTGSTAQAPTGETAQPAAAPTTGQAAGRAGQAPQESEHTRLIRAEAIRQDVDPDLAVAVATQESYLNPNAVGDGGEAKGYFQLHKDAATDAKIDPARRHEPKLNIQGGVTYLKQKLAQTKGNVDEALKLYNGGGDPNYVANVRRFLPGGAAPGGAGARAAAGTTGTAQAPPTDPRIAGLEARIKKGQALVLEVANQPGMEGQAALLNQQVNDLQKERDRLVDRSTEISRALEKETALQPLKIAQQEAGARIQNEAEMNKPIGTENAIKMDLPAETKWKDVPKGTKVLDRPGEGVATKLGEYKSSYDGITRVIGMLDQPGATSIVGTLFSEPDASFRRRAGEWISSVTPQERKFAAAMVAEIASIRHALAGSAVSPEEAAFVKDMMPKTSDPDVGTVRAKLEVLQEWVATKHEGMRDQLEQMRFRAPKALPRSTPAQAPSGLTPDQQRLLDKHTAR